jgi:hypothetical protein
MTRKVEKDYKEMRIKGRKLRRVEGKCERSDFSP